MLKSSHSLFCVNEMGTAILQEAQPFLLVSFSIGKTYADVNYKKCTLY